MSTRATLAPFLEAKLIGKLEVVLVEYLERIVGKELADEARIAIAFASVAPKHGHVCADLGSLSSLVRHEVEDGGKLPFPEPQAALRALRDCALARDPSDPKPTPLVLDGERLYLDRFFLDEKLVHDGIAKRLTAVDPLSNEEASRLRAFLAALFPGGAEDPKSADQLRAAATALLRKLMVLTGGPGTGKTTTVVKLLAALTEKAGRKLEILLLAPTGKAAARMAESVRAQLDKVPEEVRELLPTEASTLHRALGSHPEMPSRFRHHADDPLSADVVVVDEASMVDLPMMARLFDALLPDAHLILVGDREQLASVDAGAVLAELAGPKTPSRGVSKAFAHELSKLIDLPASLVQEGLPPIADAVVELRHSHRFTEHGGIGKLAKAIQSGDEAKVLEALNEKGVEYVRPAKGQGLPDTLMRTIVDAYAEAIRRERSPEEALNNLLALRVLCAHRRGALGVEGMNAAILEALREKKIVTGRSAFFHGRVVMITENDRSQNLFNGDIGIVREVKGETRVYFESALDGKSPARLPAHETAFAMTIHKSQGSEFDHAIVVLPDEPSKIVTRELLYTGITRAKQKVTVVGNDEVLRAAVHERIIRASGLEDWLWRRGPHPMD